MKVIYLGIPEQKNKSHWKKLKGKISIGSKVEVEKILDEVAIYRAKENL